MSVRSPIYHPRALVAVLALLGVLSGLIAPAAAAAADRDRIRAFLQVTGFDVALESIALSAELAPDMLGMSASDFGQSWTRTADQVFEVAAMQRMATDMLEATLEEDLLEHAAGFYASDLGQRLVEVENASHLTDDELKRAEGEALLTTYQADDPARLQIVSDLVDAVDSGEHGVRAVQEIQVRFLMAASRAGVLDYEIDEGALRAVLGEGAEELRQSIRENSLASSAYTYRDFSDADLEAYIAALRDPRMQQVYELMNAIQHEVMASRFELLADRLAGLRLGEEL